jgi:hypothetical protein
MKNSYKFLVLLFITSFFILTAQKPEIKRESSYLSRPLDGRTTQTLLNINNITSWHYYDGMSGISPNGNSGVIYPRGTAGVIYQDGVLWGGYVHDGHPGWPALRVGGQTYRVGTAPGWIVTPGDSINPPQAINPDNPRARIYRIRRDWQTLSYEELRRDAMELHSGHPEIGQEEINAVRTQYETNWNEWPVDLGAPFYDLNNNGIYEPQLGEEPGLFNADQVIWFVCNDLDSLQTYDLYGSPPMGFELQVSIWGYKSGGPLAQTNFRRFRLINKSGFVIDSMFIGQFSDPDVGDYTDDLVGCDSVMELGYSYNAYETDDGFQPFSLPPSAAGFLFLENPIVRSPGDTAIVNLKEIPDWKNLGMTSFTYHAAGPPYGGVPGWDYGHTLEMYNQLRGYLPFENISNPIPYFHGSGPNTGQLTKFPLNGDPLTGGGDIDGQGANPAPSDRRMMISSGPFAMQPGDTQEVIFALVGGNKRTGDNLTSLAAMRNNATVIKSVFEDSLKMPRDFTLQITPLGDNNTWLSVRLDLTDYPDANGCQFHFSPQFGREADFDLFLFDDGSHDDSLAGDGIWGNSITVLNRRHPYKADLFFNTPAKQYDFEEFYSGLRLRPEPQFSNWRISWENGKQDGKINYNERVHLSFDLLNRDHLNSIELLEIKTPDNELFTFQDLPAGQLISGLEQYIAFTAPAEGKSVTLYLSVRYDDHRMTEKVTFPLQEWYPNPLQGEQLEVIAVSGYADHLSATVADPTLLTGHRYQITLFETASRDSNELWWRVTDLTTAEVKLNIAPLANRPDFPNPVVDGIEFQLIKAPQDFKSFEVVANAAGPIDPSEIGCIAFNNGFPLLFNNLYPQGATSPNSSRQQTNGSMWVVHTGNTPANDGTYSYFKLRVTQGDTLWPLIIPYDFEIRFTGSGGWGFAPNAYTTGELIGGTPIEVPFELWNIGKRTPDDPSDDYRLFPYLKDSEGDSIFDLAPIDHPVSGGDNDPETDWFYWVLPADQSPGQAGYQAIANDITADPANHEYLGPLTAGTEVMRRMVLVNWNGGSVSDTTFPANVDALMPEPGTVFRISTVKPNSVLDTLRVTAPTAKPDSIPPRTPFLLQNYPNPFNDQTTIPIYLPNDQEISLEIYNILGQRVKTLVKAKLREGYHRIMWDGRSDAGVAVGSGVYFYRLKAGTFVKTRKLILLK